MVFHVGSKLPSIRVQLCVPQGMYGLFPPLLTAVSRAETEPRVSILLTAWGRGGGWGASLCVSPLNLPQS